MNLPVEKQETYYEKYWNKIEHNTKYDVSPFVRDYLKTKQQWSKENTIYEVFKNYVYKEYKKNSIEDSIVPLLEDMLKYAKRYNILLGGDEKVSRLSTPIAHLNRIKTTVTRPFFLEVLRLYDENKLNIEQVSEIFITIENYYLRRIICDVPSNSLGNRFDRLHNEIMSYDGTDTNYVEKFKYALLSKKENARFPDDKEFSSAFVKKQIYSMSNSNKVYILERIENFGTVEDKDVYRHYEDGTFSVEHIMPQTLTKEWKESLGEDCEQIHNEWLHRIANLTLTAYNSKYTNSSFAEKKTMPNGFANSGIRMNSWIAKKDKWTLDELEERSRYLKELALDIWPLPKTSFKPKKKQSESFTLGDEADLTGREICRFAFKQTEQDVKKWADMFQKVVQILFDEDKSIISKLTHSDDESFSVHFRRKSEKNCVRIAEGIYLHTGTPTQYKQSVLRHLFNLYDEDPSDLVFYLKEVKDTENEDAQQ